MSDARVESLNFASKTVKAIYSMLADKTLGQSHLIFVGESHGDNPKAVSEGIVDNEPDIQALYAHTAALEAASKFVPKEKVIFAVELSQRELDLVTSELQTNHEDFIGLNHLKPMIHAIDYALKNGFKVVAIDSNENDISPGTPDRTRLMMEALPARDKRMMEELEGTAQEHPGAVIVAAVGALHLKGLAEGKGQAKPSWATSFATVGFINAAFPSEQDLIRHPNMKDVIGYHLDSENALQVHAPKPLRESILSGAVTVGDITADIRAAAEQFQTSEKMGAVQLSPEAWQVVNNQIKFRLQQHLVLDNFSIDVGHA
jgi:hypothetical protein